MDSCHYRAPFVSCHICAAKFPKSCVTLAYSSRDTDEYSFFQLLQKLSLILLNQDVIWCGGLTLAGCQVHTKATLSLPASAEQGRENIMKGLWVKIRTGRDHLPITIMGKTDSAWGKLTQFITNQNQSRIMRNKTKY